MSSQIQVVESFAKSKAKRRRNFFVTFGIIMTMGLLSFSILTHVNAKAQNSTPPAKQSSLAGNEYMENQLIIKFTAKVDEYQKNDLLKGLNPVTLRKLSLIGAELIQISGMSVKDAINSIKHDPRVEYVEPNYIWHADIIPNDPDFNLLWGLHNTGQTGGTVDADIDAVEAWNITTGDSVIIGIIDTGVDTAHVELHSNTWTNPGEIPGNGMDDDGNGYVDDMHGWDFVNWDNGPIDDNGHGTHCSGTIAGIGNNSVGVAGVCWSAKIMALKFLDSGGYGNTADAILAVEYATMMGANLTSNSWGGGSYSQALKDAIDSSGVHGMLFVVAAGNSWNDNDLYPFYPASYTSDNIIAVAATDHNDNLVNESNWGSNWGLTSVDLGAPGLNIYSTVPGSSYGYKSGTSMATPHVAGAAALTWSQYPNLTHLQVKQRLMDMVDPDPSLAGKCVTGGRLNVFMAMAEPDSIPPSPISDLTVIGTEGSKITLSWTATGDDSISGTASSYDVRYSLSPIDSITFNSATQTLGEPNPKSAGLPDTFTVTGLDFSTLYYFAIKVFDEWNNPSGVSNSPSGTTLGPPDISVSPDSLMDSLFTGDTSTQILTVYNSGISELFFDISIEETDSSFVSIRINPSIPRSSLAESGIGDFEQKSNDAERQVARDKDWLLQILRANENAAKNSSASLPYAQDHLPAESPWIRSANDIFGSRWRDSSFGTDLIYAVVLDGLGTWNSPLFIWDELNANWSNYGDREILIDYSTFHAISITYEGLVASQADVLIISDNWNPGQGYGAFTQAEAMAIAQYVNEGAGLYITGGTFNNGEYPELQYQTTYLAPLVGLNGAETYYWNSHTYGPLYYEVANHPLLEGIPEPFTSEYQSTTVVPSAGSWTSAAIPTGTLVGISTNDQTALIAFDNRVYHSALPEACPG